jgi:hypothetical protein
MATHGRTGYIFCEETTLGKLLKEHPDGSIPDDPDQKVLVIITTSTGRGPIVRAKLERQSFAGGKQDWVLVAPEESR